MVITERQAFCVGLDELHVADNTAISEATTTNLQHGVVDIGDDNATPRTRTLGKQRCKVASATGHVDDLLPLAYAALAHSEVLPHSVQTE